MLKLLMKVVGSSCGTCQAFWCMLQSPKPGCPKWVIRPPLGHTARAFVAKGHMTRCMCTGSDVAMTSQHPFWCWHVDTKITEISWGDGCRLCSDFMAQTRDATYIPLCHDRHLFVWGNSKSTVEIQDNVQDKSFLTIFFLTKNFFSDKNFFSQIFSHIDFCHRLDFVLGWIFSCTEFCLGLHTAIVCHVESFNFLFKHRTGDVSLEG